jgi:hypothetical protein
MRATTKAAGKGESVGNNDTGMRADGRRQQKRRD